jgi:hypothetical protein
LAAFTCYFDASGTQHDQLVLAVAGFMSTPDCWIQFEKAWCDRLALSGLSRFHRRKFNPTKHPGLLEDLAAIARDHAMRKFGFVVRVRMLHNLVSADTLKKWNLDAYSYASRACAAHVRLWAYQNNLRGVPEIVFATGDDGRDQLEARLRKDGLSRNIRFQPSHDQLDRKTGLIIRGAVPLQASDLFSYELFDPARTIEETGKAPASLSKVWFILDKVPGDPQIASYGNLKEFNGRIKRFSGQTDRTQNRGDWRGRGGRESSRSGSNVLP